MPNRKVKIILPIISWVGFFIVIFTVNYPQSLANASFKQLSFFFIPLVLSIFLTLNFFLKSFYKSFIISFGIVLLLILKALDVLNLVTFTIAVIGVYLLLGSFKKNHSN